MIIGHISIYLHYGQFLLLMFYSFHHKVLLSPWLDLFPGKLVNWDCFHGSLLFITKFYFYSAECVYCQFLSSWPCNKPKINELQKSCNLGCNWFLIVYQKLSSDKMWREGTNCAICIKEQFLSGLNPSEPLWQLSIFIVMQCIGVRS